MESNIESTWVLSVRRGAESSKVHLYRTGHAVEPPIGAADWITDGNVCGFTPDPDPFVHGAPELDMQSLADGQDATGLYVLFYRGHGMVVNTLWVVESVELRARIITAEEIKADQSAGADQVYEAAVEYQRIMDEHDEEDDQQIPLTRRQLRKISAIAQAVVDGKDAYLPALKMCSSFLDSVLWEQARPHPSVRRSIAEVSPEQWAAIEEWPWPYGRSDAQQPDVDGSGER